MAKRRALRVIPKYDADNNIGAVDRVRFCIINGRMDELTQSEREQMERWRQIDAWIRQGRYTTVGDDGSDKEEFIAGHSGLRQLAMAYFGISWDTAERDIYNTKKFCATDHDDQAFYRSVYIEKAERLEWEAKNACRPDFRAAEKALRLAAELRGMFDEVVEDIPNEKLANVQFIIEYNPEAIGLKTIENKEEVFERWLSKTRNATDRMADDSEEVEYE
jgi:hypothetical protein